MHSPTLTRVYQLGLSQPALVFQQLYGVKSAHWLALLRLICRLLSHLCEPPRRDAELSGHWGLCFVARRGTMPGLVVARAPVSTQEREDISGEFGYRTAESSLLHTHLPPCLKIPSFILVSVCTHSEGLMLHHLSKGGNMQASPGGWWLCSQLMRVHGQELPSTAVFLLGSAKVAGSLNSGKNWLPLARICAHMGFSLWSTHFG